MNLRLLMFAMVLALFMLIPNFSFAQTNVGTKCEKTNSDPPEWDCVPGNYSYYECLSHTDCARNKGAWCTKNANGEGICSPEGKGKKCVWNSDCVEEDEEEKEEQKGWWESFWEKVKRFFGFGKKTGKASLSIYDPSTVVVIASVIVVVAGAIFYWQKKR